MILILTANSLIYLRVWPPKIRKRMHSTMHITIPNRFRKDADKNELSVVVIFQSIIKVITDVWKFDKLFVY